MDGREVAVKVQYPGVAAAVRADMQNLGMIMRLLKRMTPGLDVKAITEEVRERIVEELDYELEAGNQRSLGRIYDGHPFIVVPKVIGELSHERVLVSEFVSGVGFEELKTRPQAERDRIGEIVFRFFLGCLYRHRQFSGDPHPGNFLLLGDGRVAFLDFGLFKRMEREPVELELSAQRAVAEGDAVKLHALLADSGFLPEPDRVDPEHLLAFIESAIWWYTTADEPVKLTPEIATKVMIESSDPRSPFFREMRHQDMRPEHLFGRRMEMLTLAVLAQLGARVNWHRIAREWMYGEPPSPSSAARRRSSTAAAAWPGGVGRGDRVEFPSPQAASLPAGGSEHLDLDEARRARSPGGQAGGDRRRAGRARTSRARRRAGRRRRSAPRSSRGGASRRPARPTSNRSV